MCSFRPPAMGVWPVPDHATVVQIRIRPSWTQIRQNGRTAKRHGSRRRISSDAAGSRGCCYAGIEQSVCTWIDRRVIQMLEFFDLATSC